MALCVPFFKHYENEMYKYEMVFKALDYIQPKAILDTVKNKQGTPYY